MASNNCNLKPCSVFVRNTDQVQQQIDLLISQNVSHNVDESPINRIPTSMDISAEIDSNSESSSNSDAQACYELRLVPDGAKAISEYRCDKKRCTPITASGDLKLKVKWTQKNEFGFDLIIKFERSDTPKVMFLKALMKNEIIRTQTSWNPEISNPVNHLVFQLCSFRESKLSQNHSITVTLKLVILEECKIMLESSVRSVDHSKLVSKGKSFYTLHSNQEVETMPPTDIIIVTLFSQCAETVMLASLGLPLANDN